MNKNQFFPFYNELTVLMRYLHKTKIKKFKSIGNFTSTTSEVSYWFEFCLICKLSNAKTYQRSANTDLAVADKPPEINSLYKSVAINERNIDAKSYISVLIAVKSLKNSYMCWRIPISFFPFSGFSKLPFRFCPSFQLTGNIVMQSIYKLLIYYN